MFTSRYHLFTANIPELLCGDSVVQEPAQILNFMRKQVRVSASLNLVVKSFDLWTFLLFLQRFNADYELTARQGADTMAYIALVEEKLRPALVAPPVLCCFLSKHYNILFNVTLSYCVPQLHTFWVDAENYANLTRPWFASRSPFPLNFLVPSHHANIALSRILLTKGEAPLHRISEVEGKVSSSLSSVAETFLFQCFYSSVSCSASDLQRC